MSVWHDLCAFQMSIPGISRKRLSTVCIAGNAMFRITVVETPSEEKWILQGQLTGEFASELSANWQISLDHCSERLRLVDLNEVTLIDRCGEAVLLQMIHQHAKFVANGLYTRHLLQELQARSEAEVKAEAH